MVKIKMSKILFFFFYCISFAVVKFIILGNGQPQFLQTTADNCIGNAVMDNHPQHSI